MENYLNGIGILLKFLISIDKKKRKNGNFQMAKWTNFVENHTWMRVGEVGGNNKGNDADCHVGQVFAAIFLECETIFRLWKSLVIKIKMRKILYNLHQNLANNIPCSMFKFTNRRSDKHWLSNNASKFVEVDVFSFFLLFF